ncbi:FAD dependent oxidoreductase-domain-containing protein [Xylaria venustula]|nr:FAD dependent oxidoreductase-domain-containing protein [Xylaria venustula]
MRITIVDFLPDDVLLTVMSDNITYRPDLKLRTQSVLIDALQRSTSDAIISSTEFNLTHFSRWRPGRTKYVVRIRVSLELNQPQVFTEFLDHGLIVASVTASDQTKAYTGALEVLERFSMDQLALVRPSGLALKREVILVGAGLVNLVTAYRLMEKGWKIRVMDAAPDPSSEASWVHFGCSHGGDDARMFTLSEMDNYNDRTLSAMMNGSFNSDVASQGWRVCEMNSLTHKERSWISDYENLPPWLANHYNEDILSLSRDSRLGWNQWQEREPELFSSCELRRDILRLYSDPQHLREAIIRHSRIGATIRVLSPDEVRDHEPALSDAIRAGAISGGILVRGFTINAHKFMAQLMCRMVARGATFEWNKRVDRVLFDQAGNVKGLVCGVQIVRAENYVISPGAYGGTMLAGTRCEGRIHGVLGAWLRLPNLEPRLEHSLKLARKGHVTEDSNITVATDVDGAPILIIGSGYGYTGENPFNVDKDLLQKIYDGLIDTAKKYFPQAYETASVSGTLTASLKYCVRPWTSNGLGLFEMRPTTVNGRFILTGGHNTGGFAQSPTIADAVAAGLEGTYHTMHRHYHPDRAMNFLGRNHTLVAEINSSKSPVAYPSP